MIPSRWIIPLVWVVLAATGLDAQRLDPQGRFILNMDYARFQYDETKNYVEMYFGFYPRLITYDEQEGVFEGKVVLLSQLRNDETGNLHLNERSLMPFTLADTSEAALHHTFVSQVGYAIPFGRYTLRVEAVDSLDPSRRDSIVLPLVLEPYPADRPSASDIEFCSSIKGSQDKSSPFYKNSLEVVPNPSLVFGVMNHPVVFTYLELYNLDPAVSYTVSSVLLNPSGKAVKQSTKQKLYGVPNAVEANMVNVTSFESGKYQLQLSVQSPAGEQIAYAERSLFIYNPHIKPTALTGVELKASELSGLTADELAAEFRQARYIARSDEIDMFSQLTSADGMRGFLSKFWADVESGDKGRFSIVRLEYLRRVSMANQRYRSFTKEGWLSDRGRVYILYGEPDEVERFPSSESGKPHEIWRYYQIENGVEFVFVDRSGFGEYTLVHSTKRGELRDDEWQRYLD